MDEQQAEQRYQQGFNDGYILSRHAPQLMAELNKYKDPDNPYLSGLASGHKVQQQEAFMKQLEKQRGQSQRLKGPKP